VDNITFYFDKFTVNVVTLYERTKPQFYSKNQSFISQKK